MSKYLLAILFFLQVLLIFLNEKKLPDSYRSRVSDKINVNLKKSLTYIPRVVNNDQEYLYVCLNELSSKGNMNLIAPSWLKKLDGQNQSICSDEASKRGPHQQVVSFSFYGRINQKRNYFQGIEENAKLMGKIYPKWIMRLYHDIPPLPQNFSITKNILKDFQEASTSNASTFQVSQGNMWRFLPMADPLVDVFVSRDLDSRLNEREKAAVDDWLNSNLTFHIMRDHPDHGDYIQAGMWGALNFRDREKLTNLTQKLMYGGKVYLWDRLDQKLLKEIIWPIAKETSKQHDSYYCHLFKEHGNMTPWPTQRSKEPYNFVGSRIGKDIQPLLQTCPVQCRPIDRQHWILC